MADAPQPRSDGRPALPPTGAETRELIQRILFGIVAAPVAIWALAAGGVPLAVLLAALAATASWELYRIARADGIRTLEGVGIALAAVVPVVVVTEPRGVFVIPPWLLAAALLLVLALAIWRRQGDGRALSAVATTLFGVGYTGGLLSFAVAIRYHPYVADDRGGTALVMLPVLLTWANDIGAYATGRLIGRRRLMPAVSPGKTVAGAVGGLGAAALLTWWYASHVLLPWAQLAIRPAWLAVFVLAVGIAGQLGDLAESLLKREAGVKNSSTLLPGHGGVLDRIDSLLFALPVAYVLFTLPGFLLPAPATIAP